MKSGSEQNIEGRFARAVAGRNSSSKTNMENAYNECRKVGIPTASQVLATAELHHILTLDLPNRFRELDYDTFWRTINREMNKGKLPRLGLTIDDVMAEGLEIIDDKSKTKTDKEVFNEFDQTKEQSMGKRLPKVQRRNVR